MSRFVGERDASDHEETTEMQIRRTLAAGALSAIALAGFAGAPANADPGTGATPGTVDAATCVQLSTDVATAKTEFLAAQKAFNARKDAVARDAARQAKADAKTDAKATRKASREGLKGHARADHAHGAKADRVTGKVAHGKSSESHDTHGRSSAAKERLQALKAAANEAKTAWAEAKGAWNEAKGACEAAESTDTGAEQPTEPTEPTEPAVA